MTKAVNFLFVCPTHTLCALLAGGEKVSGEGLSVLVTLACLVKAGPSLVCGRKQFVFVRSCRYRSKRGVRVLRA